LCEEHPDKVVCRLSLSDYIFKNQLDNLAKVSSGYQPENIKFYTYAKLMNMSEGAINYYRFQGDGGEIVNESFRIIDEVKDCRCLFDELNGTLSASRALMYACANRYYEGTESLFSETNIRPPRIRRSEYEKRVYLQRWLQACFVDTE
jgi:hypothetical protein